MHYLNFLTIHHNILRNCGYKTFPCCKIHLDFPGYKQRPLAVVHKKIRASSPFKQSTAREISFTGLFKQSCTSSAYKWILVFKRYPGKSLTYREEKVVQRKRIRPFAPQKNRLCTLGRYECISSADVLENPKKNLSFRISIL